VKRYFFYNKLYCVKLENLGYTTLWRDHFGAARFVVAFFCVAHFEARPFWSRHFWREIQEIIFFFSYFLFLMYKKKFRLFIFFKTVEDLLFIFNKFLSTLHKKIQVQTNRYCFFIRLFQ